MNIHDIAADPNVGDKVTCGVRGGWDVVPRSHNVGLALHDTST